MADVVTVLANCHVLSFRPPTDIHKQFQGRF